MKTKLLLASVFVMAIVVSNANAQMVQRAKIQHHRIKQGVRSGELTKAEAVNLRAKEKDIHQDIKTAKSDGIVTKDERKEIRKDENQSSRAIYRKKHNNRERH